MKDGKKKRKKIDLKEAALTRKIWNRTNKIKDTPDKNADKVRNIAPSSVIQMLSESFIFMGEQKKRTPYNDFEEWLYFEARRKSLCVDNFKFHGTSFAGLIGIIKRKRIEPSPYGMLGPGVYVGHWEKAKNFGDVILKVNCDMGKITHDVSDRRADTVVALKGSSTVSRFPLLNDEWCIRNPFMVEIWGIYIKKSILEVNNV